MTAALLLTFAATSASARADDVSAADKADMQCFALMAYLGGQTAEGSPEQTGLAGGMMYFLGRLEGRSAGTDWLKRLADYILTLEGPELNEQGARCGGILADRGKALVEWGASLSAAGSGD